MIRSWRLRHIAGLGLCLGLLSAAPGFASPCEREPVARAALRNDAGYLSVEARLAGQPVRLMIDTGSEAGLITPEAAAFLLLPAQPGTRVRLQGTGGDRHALAVVRGSALAIGGLTLGDVLLPVGALPAAPRLAPPVVGFLGGDVLGQFDLEMDIPHGSLTLWRVRLGSLACASPPAWAGRFHAAPLSTQGVRLALDIELDGHSMRALLDTGARSRIVSTAAARRLGVTQAMLAAEPGGLTSGVDMREQDFHWHRFRRLVIAGDVAVAPVLTVAPLSGPFDLLLGTDWLAGRQVWISYAAHRLFWR